jgi:transcriptional regulator GlxA family with amidase domain
MPMPPHHAPDLPRQRIGRGLATVYGAKPGNRLAAWVGLSQRQLERLFKRQVGLSPKQLCRSLRFKSVFQQLALSPISTWAATAQSCGYYDQPHMIRDFKHYAGKSPASFFKNANEVDGFFIGNFHNQPES